MSTDYDPRHAQAPAPHRAHPPRSTRRLGRLAVAGVASAATVAAVMAATTGPSAQAAIAASNAGFEHGLAGWATSAAATSVTAVAHGGGKAVALTAGRDRRVALRDRPNVVRDTNADRSYVATAWVKADKGTKAILRIREKNRTADGARTLATVRTAVRVGDAGWTRLSTTISPGGGHELAVAVVGRTTRAGRSMLVDDVSVSATPRASSGPATPAPRPGKKSSASGGSGATLFGLSLHAQPSESTTAALSRRLKQTGAPDIDRVFYPGAPLAWPGQAGQTGRPVVVSFKLAPQQVVTGKYDSQLSKFFSTAPTDRKIYWSYFHEPEDNVEKRDFTAAQYRQAWTHISALANRAGKSNLKATLILMSWSVSPKSGRNWKDYYAGSGSIDVLGWDAYNDAAKPKSRTKAYDTDFAKIFGQAIQASRSVGKPFGFAEWGTLRLSSDGSGSGRASWITSAGRYIENAGAQFATYFDTLYEGKDYRLSDRPSQQAMASLFNT